MTIKIQFKDDGTPKGRLYAISKKVAEEMKRLSDAAQQSNSILFLHYLLWIASLT